MKNGILLLKGKVKLLTPALIGSGKSDVTKMDVILDSMDKPFIPASSLVGVLRHRFKLSDPWQENLDAYWGYSRDDKGRGSALCCSDLVCLSEDVKISTRDGIAVDSLSGMVMVKPEALYNYQVVEPGAIFDLNLEVTIKDDDDKDFFKQMTAAVVKVLEAGEISIGAKTNNGLGKIQLIDGHLFEVDFSKKDHVRGWFQYLKSRDTGGLEGALQVGPFDEVPRVETFSIDADFKLKNSLIIRSYSDQPGDPDSVHIKSVNKPIVPGASIRGAIRARAERILNTLGIDKATELMNDLFGYVHKENNKKKKGKLRIEETILPAYPGELQTRIKIDRFTGGTIDGALFDSMPLFKDKENEKTFKINLSIKEYKPHEAGLMLLILKDLWTGDLAVGGEKSVGRGVFQGHHAVISRDDGPPIKIDKDISKLEPAEKETLQELVDALVNYKEEG